jgi:chromosome segregation ATPase
MPELYDEDGNPVEALTKEESDAAVEKAAEDAKAEAAKEAEPKIKELEAELAKANDKAKNIQGLRDKTEIQKEQEGELQKKIADLEHKVDEEKGSGVKAFLETIKDDGIKSLAGKDADLEKKIRENYEVLNIPTATKEQVNDRIRRAYLLSVEGVSPADRAMGATHAPAGPGRPLSHAGGAEDISPELQQFASSRFGVSEEDMKKFGGAKTSTK